MLQISSLVSWLTLTVLLLAKSNDALIHRAPPLARWSTADIIHSSSSQPLAFAARNSLALNSLPRLRDDTSTLQSSVPDSRKSTSTALQAVGKDDEDFIPSTPLDRPVLATIDAAMLFLFASIGKASHSNLDGSLDVMAVFQTAAPFLLSWFAVAPFLGTFTPMATGDLKESTLYATKAWALAIPLGCVLRGIIKGYIPPTPFVIVTMIATWVLLVGGRALYTAASELVVEFL